MNQKPPVFQDKTLTIYCGDALEVLKTLPDESVNCCVTSPPYFGLRDYGVAGQIGLEETPEAYVAKLVEVFREVRRVLRDDGTVFLNLGDSYGEKNLIGIPWMMAFALRSDGWYLRQDLIWSKPNPMPESVTDRCTKSHEYIFLLSKSQKYFYDADAIAEPITDSSVLRLMQDVKNQEGSARVPGKTNGKMKAVCRKQFNPSQGGGGTSFIGHSGYRKADGSMICKTTRNKRSVWIITTKPYSDAHFATFPEELPRNCILAGCPQGGVVLDPFAGSGTTGKVAEELGRKSILI